MRTYFQMIQGLRHYKPEKMGLTSGAEFSMIASHFGLSKMNRIDLENLRDMVLLVYDRWLGEPTDDFQVHQKKIDAMQSIIHVIDTFKYKAGEEV